MHICIVTVALLSIFFSLLSLALSDSLSPTLQRQEEEKEEEADHHNNPAPLTTTTAT